MPNKKSNSEKKNSKQPKANELSDEQASQVRGGADGSVRNWDLNPGSASPTLNPASPTLTPTNKTIKS